MAHGEITKQRTWNLTRRNMTPRRRVQGARTALGNGGRPGSERLPTKHPEHESRSGRAVQASLDAVVRRSNSGNIVASRHTETMRASSTMWQSARRDHSVAHNNNPWHPRAGRNKEVGRERSAGQGGVDGDGSGERLCCESIKQRGKLWTPRSGATARVAFFAHRKNGARHSSNAMWQGARRDHSVARNCGP